MIPVATTTSLTSNFFLKLSNFYREIPLSEIEAKVRTKGRRGVKERADFERSTSSAAKSRFAWRRRHPTTLPWIARLVYFYNVLSFNVWFRLRGPTFDRKGEYWRIWILISTQTLTRFYFPTKSGSPWLKSDVVERWTFSTKLNVSFQPKPIKPTTTDTIWNRSRTRLGFEF